jgi:hypothetical protein
MTDVVSELAELAHRYGTDKGFHQAGKLSGKGYVQHYAPLLEPMRLSKMKLLEVGVFHGASLKMWHDFLPTAHIFGIDNKASAQQYEGDRTTILLGHQERDQFLNQVIKALESSVDVVVDDGSHKGCDQVKTLARLFPFVTPRGFYAIEDLHVQGRPEYGDETLRIAQELVGWLMNRTPPTLALERLGRTVGLIGGVAVYSNIMFLFPKRPVG